MGVPALTVRGLLSMRVKSKRYVWVLAIAGVIGVGGGSLQAVAAPFFQQGQAPDYSKNKRYQQGMREGKDDHAHNKDHSRKRQFKNPDDQKAYEAGYQKGHGD